MTLRLAFVQLFLLLGSFSLQAETFPRNTDNIINHLEFLGYTCEKTDAIVRANHRSHWNFSFYEAKGGISFRSVFILKPQYYNNETDLNKAIIKVMRENVFLLQPYTFKMTTGELILLLHTWTPDYYNRDHFSNFINCWEEELKITTQKLDEFLG